MVAGRIGIAHSARLFKGHILFEGPHPTLRATSLYPPASSSITGLLADILGNWTVRCLRLSSYRRYTAGVIWKSVKELKETFENVGLRTQKALQPKKGWISDMCFL